MGHASDRPAAFGPAIQLTAANIGPSQQLPVTAADGVSPASIQLAFDQLLLPSSITRQSFVLSDLQGNDLTPTIVYDPVARVVSLTPLVPLTPGQTYRLTVLPPQSAKDPNGLRSIGGAGIAASFPTPITFLAASGTQSAPATSHAVDFCGDVMPILAGSCGTSQCHSGTLPAAGLALSSPAEVLATAIGRTAEGSNTGAIAAPPEPPGVVFGVDTPIVDPGTGAPAEGNPADSWLVYKLLLAQPSPCSTEADAGVCSSDTAPTPPPTYDVAWQPLPAEARATLSNLVQGNVMPYPPATTLTLMQMETISFWIAAGAPVAPSCP